MSTRSSTGPDRRTSGGDVRLKQPKLRLDRLLVARGLAPTRSRAHDLISQGHVLVEGAVITRPAAAYVGDVELQLAESAWAYVSRGALKLIAALDHFAISPAKRTALDVGASTGGFTEVLLERGARKVYAVDVGRGQLAARLAGDPRVNSLEGVDIRDLETTRVAEAIDLIVADVSFISLTKALPRALALAGARADLIALVKPQFEAGPEHVARDGIVRDEKARRQALDHIDRWLNEQPGWCTRGAIESPLPGRGGNIEFLIAARHEG